MPNRIIKESIRTSRSVNAMTDLEFRFWVYLITYVDDYGRGSADPELLKGFVFPRLKTIRESVIEKLLASLDSMGAVQLYEVGGEPHLCLPNWENHQRIQTKKSKFPPPPEESSSNARQETGGDSIPPLPTVTHCDPPPESESESNPNPKTKNTPSSGKPDGVRLKASFDLFWAAYPKKKSKGDAEKAWKAISPSEALTSAMIERLEIAKRCPSWMKDGGQFVPYPATWLRAKGWEDAVEADVHSSVYAYGGASGGDKEGDSL